jgi:hypothetical protein
VAPSDLLVGLIAFTQWLLVHLVLHAAMYAARKMIGRELLWIEIPVRLIVAPLWLLLPLELLGLLPVTPHGGAYFIGAVVGGLVSASVRKRMKHG